MAAEAKNECLGYTICSICPTFTVHDWAKAEPVMEQFIEATKSETGCVYYGWTRQGDKLKCRECYLDAASVLAHLDNVGPLIGAITADGVATMDDINVQGPADQIALIKPTTDAFGTVHYDTCGGFTNIQPELASDEREYTFCSIHPTFTVHDWAKAEPIMQNFVESTRSEGSSCVYYGWVRTGDKLKCREAYVDGAAVLAHLDNVGALIGALTAEGVATMDGINIHGPAAELEVVRPATEAFGTQYYATSGGFSRFVLA